MPIRRGPRRSQSEGGPLAHAAGPRWSQSEQDALAHAAVALVVPKHKRPPRPCGRAPNGPKAKEGSPHMRQGRCQSQSERGPLAHEVERGSLAHEVGRRWSQSEGGQPAHAAGPLAVPKRKRPPRPCGRGLGGPKMREAPWPMRRGPRWSQSEGGPVAHTPGTSAVPK